MKNLRDTLSFFRAFAKSPFQTGSLAPSSRGLAREMVRHIDPKMSTLIVEIGPGTGAITSEILAALHDTRKYLGIELNENFVKKLRQRFPNAHFEHGSAEHLDSIFETLGKTKASAIISGIPWTLLSFEQQKILLMAISRNLGSKASFSTFAYVHSLWMPTGRQFQLLLHEVFGQVWTSPVVWKNFPPAIVYHCHNR